jgi:small-conductance mechanosensitive channel
MADLLTTVGIVAATFAAILVPFVVVPEIFERLGHNPRRAFVRGVVWALFLAIVLIPAAATGFLFSVTNLVDWILFVLALVVAILYDYYRLNPTKIPWARVRT